MILEEIAEKTRCRISEEKKKLPLTEIRRQAEAVGSDNDYLFKKALAAEGIFLHYDSIKSVFED